MDLADVFTDATPELIDIAWRFVGRSPRVEKLWVYATAEDDFSVIRPFYAIDGRVCTAAEAARLIEGADASEEAVDDLIDDLDEVLYDMEAAVGVEEFPTRTVLAFITAEEIFDADFYFGNLQPGVPVDEMVPDVTLAERWLERLRETGDDSAGP